MVTKFKIEEYLIFYFNLNDEENINLNSNKKPLFNMDVIQMNCSIMFQTPLKKTLKIVSHLSK